MYAVHDEHGRELVLKLPGGRGDAGGVATAEAAALTAWGSIGCAARVVDFNSDALLLVRCRPGTQMLWVTEESLDETVQVAAAVLARIWAADPGPHGYTTLATDYPEHERIAREDADYAQRECGEPHRGRPGLELLPAAAAQAGRLIATAGIRVLLHGDFITKNLLRDHTSPAGYLGIDPRPQIGEPAAEAGFFAAYQPANLMLPTAEALARQLGLEPSRVLRWTAIWVVHQTAQAWREDQPALEQLVVSAKVKRLLAA